MRFNITRARELLRTVCRHFTIFVSRKLREDYQNALPLQCAREYASISLFSSYVLSYVRTCVCICVCAYRDDISDMWQQLLFNSWN